MKFHVLLFELIQMERFMRPQLLIILILTVLLGSCERSRLPQSGSWRAVLIPDTSDATLEIPFNLEIYYNTDQTLAAAIRNGNETIAISEIIQEGDSIHFHLPVFEGTIDTRIGKSRLEGTYTHRGSGRSWTIPFFAEYGITDRFPEQTATPAANLTGRWEVWAGAGDQAEKQVGEFVQTGSRLTGTFLTTTGDYRYLDGKVSGSKMMFSAFDGAHALVFEADISADGQLVNGTFCGGPTWKGVWTAVRNDTVTLPDPKTLTFLKPGYEKLEFAFPDLEGNPVNLNDTRFSGKTVIVQILGSWCPNCMDETRFFAGLYRKYKAQGLEIIGLCYESNDPVKSALAIRRFRDQTDAGYTFLYAGESNKRKAAETLPMLNRILSYPTSVFIDKKGKVRAIFTGFSGPGTGAHYEQLSGEMEELLKTLLSENL
jgi:thiol-disulfide isomerase/thioredoxin